MDKEQSFFYANSLEVAASAYDINLKFIRQGTAENAPEGESKPVRLAEAVIAMSPNHAKAMLASLYNAVQAYEKTIGPISIPKDMQESFNKTFGTANPK